MRVTVFLLLVMSGVVSAQNAPDNAAAEAAKKRIATLKLSTAPKGLPLVLSVRTEGRVCAIPLTNVLPKETRAAGLPADVIKPMPACDEAMFQNK